MFEKPGESSGAAAPSKTEDSAFAEIEVGMRGLEGTNPWLREAEVMYRRLGHSL